MRAIFPCRFFFWLYIVGFLGFSLGFLWGFFGVSLGFLWTFFGFSLRIFRVFFCSVVVVCF